VTRLTRRRLLELMRANVQLNGLDSKRVRVEELNWGDDLPEWLEEDVELVLAADCVYFEVGTARRKSYMLELML
jgi:hypothetical protein